MIDASHSRQTNHLTHALHASSPLVCVVDDEPSVRRTIRLLIESAGLTVAEFASAEEFARSYDSDQPGCLVIDHQLMGITGLDFIETVPARFETLSCVLITGFANTDTVVRAMKAGAVQVLDKPFDAQRLLQAIDEALSRNQSLRQRHELTAVRRAKFASLTEREREVLRLLVEGQMNKNISKRLSISVRAVEQRRRQIFLKTGTASVAELVSAVLQLQHEGINVLGPD